MAKSRYAAEVNSVVVTEKDFQKAVRALLNTPPKHKPAKKSPTQKRRAFR